MKLIRTVVSFALACLMTSAAFGSTSPEANLDHGGVPIAIHTALITPGKYVPTKPSFFTDVTVRVWFNRTYLEGLIYYAGRGYRFSTEVSADVSNGEGAFLAQGEIIQNWSNGVVCNIPMYIEIQREGEALHFRSQAPGSIRTEAQYGYECTNYNNYRWTFHDQPYVRKANQQ